MKRLIIFIAPPGAGKTELANYLCENHPNSIILNKTDFTKEKTEQEYFDKINQYLKEYDWVILDSQNVLYGDRVRLFNNLKLEDTTKIIGIWIEVSRKEAYSRNKKKLLKEQSKKSDIDFLFKYKMSPIPEEPFEDVYYIMRDANIAMSKSYPYITTTFGILDRFINDN